MSEQQRTVRIEVIRIDADGDEEARRTAEQLKHALSARSVTWEVEEPPNPPPPPGARALDTGVVSIIVATIGAAGSVAAAAAPGTVKWLRQWHRDHSTAKFRIHTGQERVPVPKGGDPAGEDSGPVPDGPVVLDPLKRHALLLTTDEYDDRALRDLRGPEGEGRQMKAALRSDAVGGYSVTLRHNLTANEMKEEVKDFLKRGGDGNLGLLYLAGHGIREAGGKLYFAARDTHARDLDRTAVSAHWLSKRLHGRASGRSSSSSTAASAVRSRPGGIWSTTFPCQSPLAGWPDGRTWW